MFGVTEIRFEWDKLSYIGVNVMFQNQIQYHFKNCVSKTLICDKIQQRASEKIYNSNEEKEHILISI